MCYVPLRQVRQLKCDISTRSKSRFLEYSNLDARRLHNVQIGPSFTVNGASITIQNGNDFGNTKAFRNLHKIQFSETVVDDCCATK